MAAWMTVAIAALLEGSHAPVYQLATSSWNPTTIGRIIDLNSLAIRRHHHGADDAPLLRRWLLKHLDVSPVAWEQQGPLSAGSLRRAMSTLRDALQSVDPRESLPKLLSRPFSQVHKRATSLAHDAERSLRRVERLLELYRPFIHDNNWQFQADVLRAELGRLRPEDAPFAYDAARIDWRRYWVDIHMPGILRWSLPLIDGTEAPQDDMVHPVRLTTVFSRRSHGDASAIEVVS
jgi:long-chain acyl-CoA synthetase